MQKWSKERKCESKKESGFCSAVETLTESLVCISAAKMPLGPIEFGQKERRKVTQEIAVKSKKNSIPLFAIVSIENKGNIKNPT